MLKHLSEKRWRYYVFPVLGDDQIPIVNHLFGKIVGYLACSLLGVDQVPMVKHLLNNGGATLYSPYSGMTKCPWSTTSSEKMWATSHARAHFSGWIKCPWSSTSQENGGATLFFPLSGMTRWPWPSTSRENNGGSPLILTSLGASNAHDEAPLRKMVGMPYIPPSRG